MSRYLFFPPEGNHSTHSTTFCSFQTQDGSFQRMLGSLRKPLGGRGWSQAHRKRAAFQINSSREGTSQTAFGAVSVCMNMRERVHVCVEYAGPFSGACARTRESTCAHWCLYKEGASH